MSARTAGACALVAALASMLGCTRARTEVIVRIGTDMTQGPSGEVGAIRVRVTSEGSAEPELDRRYELGAAAGTILPSELGLVPASRREGLVVVEVDALSPDGARLFTHRASVHYVPERTLLLEVMLARRCLDLSAQACPSGQTCGALACEDTLRQDLPDYTPSEFDAGVPADARAPVTDAQRADAEGDASLPMMDADTGPPSTDAATVDAALDGGPDVAPPRPIEPTSSGITLSTTVRFRWDLSGPATGARLEICNDRACTDVRETQDVTGTNTSAVLDVASGESRVLYFRLFGRTADAVGHTPSPTWAFRVSGRPGVSTSASWGVIEDYDGDGLADMAVGAPASSTVRVYRGRAPIGSPPSPSATITGSVASALGTAIASVGDVDGDGFADLAVAGASEVLLFRGRAGGLPSASSAADASARVEGVSILGAHSLAAAGDVDRDGYADVVVGDAGGMRALLFFGRSTGLAPGLPVMGSAAGFGRAVAGRCDVNADGYSDLIVGANDAAFVVFGSGSGAGMMVELSPPAAARGFGAAVACAGDVDADGYADVIVGAPGDRAAFIFHGRADGVSTTASGALRKAPGDTGTPTKHGESFGAYVAAAGDVNGDGYGDVVVTAPDLASGLADDAFVGYVFVFHGSSGGLPSTAPGSSTTHARAIGASMMFAANRGQSARGIGDMDGDGFDDLVSGTPLRDGGAGAVLLNMGAAGGLPSASVWLVSGAGVMGLGTTLASLHVLPRRAL